MALKPGLSILTRPQRFVAVTVNYLKLEWMGLLIFVDISTQSTDTSTHDTRVAHYPILCRALA
jgi:hypothetical protein